MGEYGFVTGDGVYHVTVYATDENGDFKILSMKNFYIGLPGEGKTTARPTTVAASRPSQVQMTTRTPTTTIKPPATTTKSPIIQHLQGLMGCSGCIIPDKKNPTSSEIAGNPPSNANFGDGLLDVRFGDQPTTSKPNEQKIGSKTPTSSGQSSFGGSKPFGQSGGSKIPSGGSPSNGIQGQTPPGGYQQSTGSQYKPPSSSGGFDQASPRPQKNFGSQQTGGGSFNQPPEGTLDNRLGGIPSSQGGNPPIGGTPQTFNGDSGPTTSPDFYNPSSPGSSSGSDGDGINSLLYKYNYTLKYHGHHESGYRNGDKEGDYFFNGRDGLGRNVEYVANEFGYQPNITLVDLGLQSPDTPREDREEPNELRGYEFKWFYNR